MLYCEFEKISDEYAVCKKCGLRIHTHHPDKIRTTCPGKRREPSIIQKAAHYAEAIATHIATGSHTRTDAEVSDLLQVCHACDRYNAEKSTCTVCGCRLSQSRSAYLSKLRMKTQSCPLKKW